MPSLPLGIDLTDPSAVTDPAVAHAIETARAALQEALREAPADVLIRELTGPGRAATRPAPVETIAAVEAAAELTGDSVVVLRRHLAPALTTAGDGFVLESARGGRRWRSRTSSIGTSSTTDASAPRCWDSALPPAGAGRRGAGARVAMTAWPPCSDAARHRGDALVATAPPVRRWLLLEQPKGWPEKILTSPDLVGVRARIQEIVAARAGRLLFVRRPGRPQPGGLRRWFVISPRAPPSPVACGSREPGWTRHCRRSLPRVPRPDPRSRCASSCAPTDVTTGVAPSGGSRSPLPSPAASRRRPGSAATWAAIAFQATPSSCPVGPIYGGL